MNTHTTYKSRLLLCAVLLIGQGTLLSSPGNKNRQIKRGPGVASVGMFLAIAASAVYVYKLYNNAPTPVLQNSVKPEDEIKIKEQISDSVLLEHIDNINEILALNGKASNAHYVHLIRRTYNAILTFVENDVSSYYPAVIYYLATKLDDLLAHSTKCLSKEDKYGGLIYFFKIVDENHKALASTSKFDRIHFRPEDLTLEDRRISKTHYTETGLSILQTANARIFLSMNDHFPLWG